jgi:DNA-binding NtrC family response regulator
MEDDRTTTQVLIADDNPANLNVLSEMLESQGYRVIAVPGGELALRIAATGRPDLILLDVVMPDLDGFETCRRLKADERTAHLPVMFASARDEVESLVQGFEAGGVDYITKPYRREEVLIRVRTHLQLSLLNRDLVTKNRELQQRSDELASLNATLRAESQRREKAEDALQTAGEQLSALSDREAARWGVTAGVDGFVGRSKTIRRILQDIRRVRNFHSVNVLITGESGTGKELVARAIHFGSGRAKGPFIPVNCVAIPEELAESMLFGHVRGAFTGATIDRKGYFELAHGGTLFLDEIGDMPVSLQAKLLRVLEDGKVTPLGAVREKQVDVRVVAATNANLTAQTAGGAFRQDLYFRLAQFSVEVPPLRDRKEDVPHLAEHFVRLFAQEMGMPVPTIDPAFLDDLATHDFPGNVRELKNIIERSLIESAGEALRPEHLCLTVRGPAVASAPATRRAVLSSVPAGGETGDLANSLPLNLEAAENLLIRRALAETGGNIAEAARRLGVNRTRIYRKMSEGAVSAVGPEPG